MKKLVFLGPGVKLDVRQRYGKDRPDYIFWSPDAPQAPYGADVDLNGELAPLGEAGMPREVTNDEAEDLLTFPRQFGLDLRFQDVTTAEPAVAPVPAVATPRSAEDIQAEVARELAVTDSPAATDDQPADTRRSRARTRED